MRVIARSQMKSKLQNTLTLIGALTSARMLHKCQAVVNYLRIGRWMTDHGFQIKQRVPNRDAVGATVAQRIADARVLYLEFGVWKGVSM